MHNVKTWKAGAAAALMAATVGAIVGLDARQAAASGPLAKELTGALAAKKIDCVALKDNGTFGRYAAALYIPGTQLTVVAAKVFDATAVQALDYRLFSKDCMGAYSDLRAAAAATERVVFDDYAGDGLVALPKKDVPRDDMVRAGKTTTFDGDSKALKALKVTPDDFQKTFAAAEDEYSGLLRLLLAEAKK